MNARLIAAIFALSLFSDAAEVTVNHRHFTVPNGFTVELVAAPPVVERPVTADFDEEGRLYVSDSSGSSENVHVQLEKRPHRILRLESSKGDGVFDKRTVFADKMMFPEGTMWLDGSLYVAGVPQIWKLTDTNGDGVADKREVWFDGKTLTGCGNDLHGPYAGPDGWIYWCKGGFAEQSYTVHGKPWVSRAAHVFRARPDGSGIEPVLIGGMDNPVEVAFTPGGEMIVSSTFIHQPENGKRDGLIHAVYGALYGKQHDEVLDGFAHTFPELMPPLVQMPATAECGLVRYEGDAFGREYRDNLFASSFNLHKVTRHQLYEDGATFKSGDSDFLVCDSLDFHPTHLLEDADGSLLIVDTGGWYKLCCPTSQLGKPDVLGAIYRVRRVDAKHVDDPRGLKINWSKLSPAELCELLADPRFAVRRRAIAMIGKGGAEAAKALEAFRDKTTARDVRVNVAWAAVRNGAPVARSMIAQMLNDSDNTVRLVAAHGAILWQDKNVFEDLLALIENPSMSSRRAAAEALGRLGDARAVEPLLNALSKPVDHVLEHSLTYALIQIGDAKRTKEGLSSDNPHVRRSAMMALDQMGDHSALTGEIVAKQLMAQDSAVQETALWIAARYPEWGEALAATLKLRLRTAGTLYELKQLAKQVAKLSSSPAIQKLVAEELAGTVGGRRAALDVIGDSGIDPLPESWAKGMASLLGDPATVKDAAFVARRLPADSRAALAEALLGAGKREDFPPEARLEALAAAPAVGTVPSPLFNFLVAQLSPNQPAARRMLAADVLGKSTLSNDQLTAMTPAMQTAGPMEINKLLDAFGKSKDETVGLKLVEVLKHARAVHALRVGTLKPKLAAFGPWVDAEAKSLYAILEPDAGEQKSRLDQIQVSLPAGDVRRGQEIFAGKKVSCVTCHSIGYGGGHVGPDLTKIGSLRSERDLLESIVFPSASFAQSYEPYTAIDNSGQRFDGILRRNDASGVTLVTGPEQEVHIAKEKLKELRPGNLSIMPSGLDQMLSKQELADLVAFLKACK